MTQNKLKDFLRINAMMGLVHEPRIDMYMYWPNDGFHENKGIKKVMKMVQPFMNQNHHVFFNNFFTTKR